MDTRKLTAEEMGRRGGLKSQSRYTKEERSERARKAARAGWANLTPRQWAAKVRKATIGKRAWDKLRRAGKGAL